MNQPRHLLIQIVLFFVGLTAFSNSSAISISPTTPTADGVYTVSWDTPVYPDYFGFGATSLQERVDGGNWVDVPLPLGTTSFEFEASTKLPDTRYWYRIKSQNYEVTVNPNGEGVTFNWYEYTAEGPASVSISPIAVTPAPAIIASSEPGKLPLDSFVDHRGKLNIALPINTPPGVNGLAPNLQLTYTDRRAVAAEQLPSLVGFGWDLQGFSSIVECNGTYFGLCYAGKALQNQNRTFGIYLNDVYKSPVDPNKKFVVKVDYSNGGSKYWLEMKSGDRIYRFGKTADARLGYDSSPNLSEHWLLQEVEDAFGNVIVYHYEKINGNSHAYPTSIDYGGYSVEFEYRRRSGTYASNSDLDIALHTIRTVVNGVTTGEYHLDYALEGGTHHVLQAIQYCGFDSQGQDSTCLPATYFDYQLTTNNNLGIDRVTNGLGQVTEVIRELEGTPAYEADHLFSETPFPLPPTLDLDDLGEPFSQTAYVDMWNVTEVRTPDGIGGQHITEFAYNQAVPINTLVRRKLPDGTYFYSAHRVDAGYYLDILGSVEGQALYDGIYGESGTNLRYKSTTMTEKSGYMSADYIKSTQTISVGDDNNLQNAIVSETINDYAWAANGVVESLTTTTNSGYGVDSSGNLVNVEKTTINEVTYENDYTNWVIGFVSDHQVTVKNVPGEAGEITARQENLKYSPNLLIAGQSTRYQNTDYELTTSILSIDGYGNPTSTQVSGPTIETRSSSVTGFIDGRYPTTITNAEGHQTTINAYDLRFGAPTSVYDINNLETTAEWDNLGRLKKTTLPNGTIITPLVELCVSCDNVEGMLGSISPMFKSSSQISHTNSAVTAVAAPQSTSYYDQLGRVIRMEQESFDGTLLRVDTIYDDLGRIHKRSLPYFVGSSIQYASFYHDSRNRVERVVYPDGTETKYQYASLPGGYKVTTLQKVKRTGQTKWQVRINEYNALGQLIKSYDGATSPDGNSVNTANAVVTEYDYDLLGNNDWVRVDGNDDTIVETYTGIAGFPESISDPSAGITLFDYDALGQIKQQTDANGIVTEFSYDRLGRLEQRIDDLLGAPVTNNWYYDKNNKKGTLSSKSSANFTEAYTYDGFVQLESVTTTLTIPTLGAKTFTSTYGYDDYGRPETQTLPSTIGNGQGVTVFTGYNNFGYANATHENNANGQLLSKIDATDHLGNIEQKTLGNGLITYSDFDPFTGLVENIQTGSIQHNQYEWWSNGSLYKREEMLGNKYEVFEYDNLNRLVKATTTAGATTRTLDYCYDNLGNFTAKTVNEPCDGLTQYNYTDSFSPYQLDSAVVNGETHTYDYDATGNMVFDEAPNTANNRNITYNAFGKPVEITKGSTSNPSATDNFAYGPDGSRYHRRSVEETDVYEAVYLYGGAFEVVYPALGTTTAIEKSYLGDVVHIREVTLTSSSDRLEYIHRDHLGSVEAMTDESGSLISDSRQHFDPFGRRRNIAWTDVTDGPGIPWQQSHTNRGFTGHEQLDGTGLIHMNGRVYDPELGRFMSADPFVQAPTYSQSYNRYAYVWNNPLSFTDPSGYSAFPDIHMNRCGAHVPKPEQDPLVDLQNEYGFGELPTPPVEPPPPPPPPPPEPPPEDSGGYESPFGPPPSGGAGQIRIAGYLARNEFDMYCTGSGIEKMCDMDAFHNFQYIKAASNELALLDAGKLTGASAGNGAGYTAVDVDAIVGTSGGSGGYPQDRSCGGR
ncbi:MAG: RHS repeat-associated core domain-containing protein, partial [Cellvibrionaceae bacterium]